MSLYIIFLFTFAGLFLQNIFLQGVSMSTMLYIQASPRIERSYSITVANAFVESYRAVRPRDEIITINLFQKDLPPFDGLYVQAKYTIMHGLQHINEERAAWSSVEALITEFKSADKYVMAVPMWNFSIPYRLKQYIDILVQPTYTFNITDAGGYDGLIKSKSIFLACSSGGEYPAGTPAEAYDFQTNYLKLILGFIGFTDIRLLTIGPTLNQGADVAKQKRAAAIIKAREMAQSF
jgi:FMN-dependent NADH-azoreductase